MNYVIYKQNNGAEIIGTIMLGLEFPQMKQIGVNPFNTSLPDELINTQMNRILIYGYQYDEKELSKIDKNGNQIVVFLYSEEDKNLLKSKHSLGIYDNHGPAQYALKMVTSLNNVPYKERLIELGKVWDSYIYHSKWDIRIWSIVHACSVGVKNTQGKSLFDRINAAVTLSTDNTLKDLEEIGKPLTAFMIGLLNDRTLASKRCSLFGNIIRFTMSSDLLLDTTRQLISFDKSVLMAITCQFDKDHINFMVCTKPPLKANLFAHSYGGNGSSQCAMFQLDYKEGLELLSKIRDC